MVRPARNKHAANSWVKRIQLLFETLEQRLPLAADFALGYGTFSEQIYGALPTAVYAPDTDPKILQQTPDALGARNSGDRIANFQFSDSNRWSSTATNGGGLTQGDPTTVTWSIVPDGTAVSGFNGEPASSSNLVAFLGSIYGVTTVDANYTDEPWFGLFQSYLNRWSVLSGMTYVYESHDDGVPLGTSAGQLGVRGDVRISGHLIDGNSNVLAYNFFPNNGDMVIDTGDAGFFGNTANTSRSLRNVLAHENGHGLGLDHVCPVTSGPNGRLMEPFINLSIDGPQFDDILAIQRGYGDVLEKNGGNNSAATATSLGTLIANQTILRGTDAIDIQVAPTEVDFVSIDDDSDVDYFSFTVGSGLGANILLTPLGATYLSGPQNANGSCSAGTSFNASRQSDLTLQLIGPGGTTVLQTSNVGGLGVAESISSGLLPAGTYTVRVSGTANAAQMYQLSITGVQVTGILITETDGGTVVAEGGMVDTYSLGLGSVPAGTVQITVTADAQTEVSGDGVNFASTAVLNFNSSVPQTVTVRAVDDAIGEGTHTSLLTHTITATADPTHYPLSLVLPSLTVTVLDNDLAQFVRQANLGSLIATSNNNSGVLTSSADHVDLSVFLSAGQTIAASATTSSGAILSLMLVDVTAPFVAPSPGAAVVLPATSIATTANYKLRVTANAATTFELQAVLNAAFEVVDSASNNELNLAPSGQTFSPEASRYAAVGRSTPTSNPLQFTASNNPSLFVDISGTGTGVNLTDDSVAFITTTVGNSIFPAGTVTISNNGGIVAGVLQELSYLNAMLPTNQFNTALLPFWDDLDALTGYVYWQEKIVGGVNTLIVQWNNRPHYVVPNSLNGVTFQVQVFESGPVLARFVYTDVDFGNPQFNSGVSATIGYQASSSSAVTYSFNTASVSSGTVLELMSPVVPDSDQYRIDLTNHVGQAIDVVLTGFVDNFSGQVLQLLAPDGTTLLATGTRQPLQVGVNATNVDLAILNFIVPSAGVYRVRVSSSLAASYGLVVSKQLTLDIEPNNLSTQPLRDLSATGQALGYLSAVSDSEDRYPFNLTAGQSISVMTRTLFDSSSLTPLNSLDPEVSMIAPDGVTVLASNQNSASDGKNARLVFTASSSGTYTIRVAATVGSGEYALAIGAGSGNAPPTLDAISNLTIFEDAVEQTIALSGITAGPSESQPLKVTATSSSLGLIPNPAVTYTSPNTTGSLALTPVTNQTGVSVITVTVEDGGLDGDLNTVGDNATFSRMFTVTVNPVKGSVVGRNLFYNNSFYDGNNQAANAADDGAIDTSKSALLPGGMATFANYTGFAKGISGIMIDIASLPATPVAGDFAFKVGNNSMPQTWSVLATAPSITVRATEGISGSDRVTLIWPTNTIINTWLEVKVLATGPNAIVETTDTFYFGSAPGEVGAGSTSIDSTDFGAVSADFTGFFDPYELVTNPRDVNKSGLVDSTDTGFVSAHFTGFFDIPLQLLNLSAGSGSIMAGGGGLGAYWNKGDNTSGFLSRRSTGEIATLHQARGTVSAASKQNDAAVRQAFANNLFASGALEVRSPVDMAIAVDLVFESFDTPKKLREFLRNHRDAFFAAGKRV